MGCASAKDYVQPAERESSETREYRVIKTDVRRAQGDVYIVTVEKSTELVFPLGGAIVFGYKDSQLIAHIVEYTRDSLRFCFLMQGGRKLAPGDVLNYSTVKTTPRLRFPYDNVVFFCGSLSVAIILQLIYIYKVNLRTNVFAVVSYHTSDIPYCYLLYKQLQASYNQVNIISSSVVTEVRTLVKDSAAAIAVGPIWLMKLVYQCSVEFYKYSYCLPFFAGVYSIDVSQWFYDDYICELEEFEDAEREFSQVINKAGPLKDVAKVSYLGASVGASATLKPIVQPDEIEDETKPRKRAAVKTKKLPQATGFPEMFDREVIEVARHENVLTSPEVFYVSTAKTVYSALLIDEYQVSVEEEVRPYLKALHFAMNSGAFIYRILYPYSVVLNDCEVYENAYANNAFLYCRSSTIANEGEYQYIYPKTLPIIAAMPFLIDQAKFCAGLYPYPFAYSLEYPNEITLISDDLWQRPYEATVVAAPLEEVVVAQEIKLLKPISFTLDYSAFRSVFVYPFVFEVDDYVSLHNDDYVVGTYARVSGVTIAQAQQMCETEPYLPFLPAISFTIDYNCFTQFEYAIDPVTVKFYYITPQEMADSEYVLNDLVNSVVDYREEVKQEREQPYATVQTLQLDEYGVDYAVEQASYDDAGIYLYECAAEVVVPRTKELILPAAVYTQDEPDFVVERDDTVSATVLGTEIPLVGIYNYDYQDIQLQYEEYGQQSQSDKQQEIVVAAYESSQQDQNEIYRFINDCSVSEDERTRRYYAYTVFSEADFSHSGTLELEEAKEAFRQQNYLNSDIEYVFNLVDSDSSSGLSFFEFYRFYLVFRAYQAQEDIRRIMFIAADRDFSNEISREEFLHILLKMNAQAKFGEDNVRSAVAYVVGDKVSADSFSETFDRVKDAMKSMLQK